MAFLVMIGLSVEVDFNSNFFFYVSNEAPCWLRIWGYSEVYGDLVPVVESQQWYSSSFKKGYGYLRAVANYPLWADGMKGLLRIGWLFIVNFH